MASANSINGQGFFEGAGKAAFIGGFGGMMSMGVGELAAGLKATAATALQVKMIGVMQTAMHAMNGGMMFANSGGDFGTGALSAGIGSVIGGGADKLLQKSSDFIRKVGISLAGSVSAGVGSRLAGGKFWDGFRNGAISAGLNHAAHAIMDPPEWKFNGKIYTSKAELYRDIWLDQAAEQFGIKDILALAAAIDGQGLIKKPFQTTGASKGTSYASKWGSKMFPQRLPIRVPTHFRGGSLRYTKVLGRFLGRAAGPIGWGLLAYDVGMTFYNTQQIYNQITKPVIYDER